MKVVFTQAPMPIVEYPFLGISNENGCIVLFAEPDRGICVAPGGSNFQGEYSACWDMYAFLPYTGKVTLENN